MAVQSLTQHQLKELLHYDPETGVFTNKVTRNPRAKQGTVAGSLNTLGYVVIQVNKQKTHAHRLAWLYVYGCWPKNQIDHINRIRNDNRLCNLRDVSRSDNCQNLSLPSHNKSGHMGISWVKQRSLWTVYIKVNKKNKWLGCYKDLDDAVAARKAGEKEYYNLPEVVV